MSDSTLALISKYLDSAKVTDIVVQLSNNLFASHEELVTFCDLVGQVDSKTITKIYPKVIEFTQLLLTSQDEAAFPDFALVAQKLPQLYDDSITLVFNYLSNYTLQSLYKFTPEVKKLMLKYTIVESEDAVPTEDPNLEHMMYLLSFLEYIFPQVDLDFSQLDYTLVFLLTIENEDISAIVARILRWRIARITKNSNDSSVIWDIIFALESTGNLVHVSHAFTLWLRYLNNPSSKFKRSKYFQSLIQTEMYWKVLQKGLVSPFHDHRKICLSILKLTLLQIHTTFSNEIFEWDYPNKEKYFEEWTRYVTLFEILAIDTSLHQAEAGQNDIISLISPDSVIHPSWGFTLLSTGFRAGTESVRKFALQLLLSIPAKSLYLIKYALPLFEEIFLPYALLASHFIIRDGVCPYGDLLADFICNIVKNLNDEDDIRLVTKSILKVMVLSKEDYDPSKIYFALGLWRGLATTQVLTFRKHDKLLIKLFETESEGEVYHSTLQGIYLNLIFNFRLDNLEAFASLLDMFIKFNGADLVNKNISKFKKYLSSNSFDDSVLDMYFKKCHNNDRKVLMVPLLNDPTIICDSLHPDVPLLASLLRSGLDVEPLYKDKKFQKWYKASLDLALTENQPVEVLSALAQAKQIRPGNADLQKFWDIIADDVQQDQESALRKVTFKFAIFNKLIAHSDLKNSGLTSNFEPTALEKFKKSIFVNFKKSQSQSKDFYKVAEEIHGEFFGLIRLLATKGFYKPSDLKDLVGLLVSDLANYNANTSIAEFSLHCFKSFELSPDLVHSWVEVLLELWNGLAAIRLQLNQRELHITLIKTLLHGQVLRVARADEVLSDKVSEFCKSVISNTPGRKCLLPTMTFALSQFQISDTALFEQSNWIAEILVEALTTSQLKTNAFKFENVIGDIYDTYIGGKKDGLYLSVYGTQEVSAQINLMAIFNSLKSTEFAMVLFQYIIDNQKKYNFYKVIKSTDSGEERIRVKLLQVITSIMDKLDTKVILKQYFDIFIDLMVSDPSPLARAYIEWFVAVMLVKSPSRSDKIFDQLQEMLNLKEAKPTLVCSYERVLFLMIQQLPTEQEVKLITKLLSILITAATSKKATIRHFSLSLTCSTYLEIERKKLPLAADSLEMARQMYDSAIHSQSYDEFRSGDALLWNIESDKTLVCISGGLLMRVSDHELEYVSQADFEKYLTKEQVQLLNHPIGENHQELWVKQRKELAKKSTFKNSNTKSLGQSPLQTKSGAWNAVMDFDDAARGVDVVRSDLIVVSSLVDKPPNLGGICRLCDVLGAGLLTLDDIKVKTHPQFKNVAVTADQWMPMEEVKVDEIADFLRDKKREGYTLIGLEQTDKSVELNRELQFPAKSLILLGKEREGIPGDLLAELDMCVEIKQVGVIRSMNIQTATAIIVHAYSSQHC